MAWMNPRRSRVGLRWFGLLALLWVGGARTAHGAIVTTGASLRVEWQVTGIPDSQIKLVRVVTNSYMFHRVIYSAPLRSMESVEASATATVEPFVTLPDYWMWRRDI